MNKERKKKRTSNESGKVAKEKGKSAHEGMEKEKK